MRNFTKITLVLIFILALNNVFAQKHYKFKLEYQLTNEVVNVVDTLINVCVLIDDFSTENISKILISTNSPELKNQKSFHEITNFDEVVSGSRFYYCLGLFNIAADGAVQVNIEIEDVLGNNYQLEKTK